jgi:hypothetical protein
MPFDHGVIYELIYDRGDVDADNNPIENDRSTNAFIKKVEQYMNNPYIIGGIFKIPELLSHDGTDDETDDRDKQHMNQWIEWFDSNNHGNKIKLQIVKLINTIGIQHLILNHKVFKSYKFKGDKYEEITSAAYKWFITNFDKYWLACECIEDLLFDNHINDNSMKNILKCLKNPAWEFE